MCKKIPKNKTRIQETGTAKPYPEEVKKKSSAKSRIL